MSGVTLMALAADEIVMDSNAVLGPVDPQIGAMPAASIAKMVELKQPSHVKGRDVGSGGHRAAGSRTMFRLSRRRALKMKSANRAGQREKP